MTGPLFTTILPTYRRPALLRRAIRSVLAQDEPRLRVLVLDNASGDDTASVVAALAAADPRVEYRCQPENLGAFANFQSGLQQVETPYFSFLSDDDVLLPNLYSGALRAFETHPEAGFVCLGVVHILPSGEVDGLPLLRWEPGLYRPPAGLVTMARVGHPVWTGTVFRREVVERVGLLDEATGIQADADFEFRAAGRFAYLIDPTPGALFTVRPPNEAGESDYPFDQRWPGWDVMVRKLAEDPELAPEARLRAATILDDRFRDWLWPAGLRYLYQNRRTDARELIGVLGRRFGRYPQAAILTVALAVHSVLGSVFRDQCYARMVVRRFPFLLEAWRSRHLVDESWRRYKLALAERGITADSFAGYLQLSEKG